MATYRVTNNSKVNIALENQTIYPGGTRSFTMSDRQYDSFSTRFRDIAFESASSDATTTDITRDSNLASDPQHVIVDNLGDSPGGGDGGTVMGSVEVSNFPSIQPVSGSLTITNFPAVQTVSVNNYPATQAIAGNVTATQSGTWNIAVSNFPATQAISGAVSVSNFPATQTISGSVTATQSGTWNIAVSNFPATQTISGSVSVSNFPATQTVIDADSFLPTVTPVTAVNGILASFDTTGYKSIAVQLTGTWAGTIVYEVSNDGLTWTLAVGNIPNNAGSAAPTSLDTVATLRIFTAITKFFRVRASVYTSGTMTAVIVLRQVPAPPMGLYVGNTVNVTGVVSAATPGATTVPVKSAATTNATVTKASAGNVFDYSFSNNTTTAKWIKFFNKATAPVVGTDTSFIKLLIPAMTTITSNPTAPLRFSVGISFAITGAVGDSDATATAVDDVTGYFTYA